MLSLSSFFFEPLCIETLLFCSLPLFLFLPKVLPLFAPTATYTHTTDAKKQFFLLLRIAQFMILVGICGDLCLLIWGGAITDTLHFGNYFFRTDRFVALINLFINALALYYVILLAFLFSRTTSHITYIIELPFLIICTLLSLRLLVSTNDFFLLVILLEILAFCSVIYLGLQSTSAARYSISIEATIKYFIINALAVSLLLLGICGYFYIAATTNIIGILLFFQQHPQIVVFFLEQLFFSYLLVISAFIIKVGGAPLHQWVPDVYEGAETIVTCFLVVLISPPIFLKLLELIKVLWVSLIKYNAIGLSEQLVPLLYLEQLPFTLFWGVALLSVFIGTIGAFYQTRIKRFIAYASLTHFGFMLLAVLSENFIGYFATFTYFFIYVFTNMCFFTLLVLSQQYFYNAQTRIIFINQLKPFVQTSFFFFLSLLVCLFSFAGIPPFAGFFAKFFVLSALAATQHFLTLGFLIIAILVGSFLYLRFLKITLFEPSLLEAPFVLSPAKMFSQTLLVLSTYYRVSLTLNSTYYIKTITTWQETLLHIFVFSLCIISFFFFCLSVYLLGIHETTIAFLSF